MTDIEFRRLVRAMRTAQRAFFRIKTHENLVAARKLEGEVDQALMREVAQDLLLRSRERETE
jgi:hypothetical protein